MRQLREWTTVEVVLVYAALDRPVGTAEFVEDVVQVVLDRPLADERANSRQG